MPLLTNQTDFSLWCVEAGVLVKPHASVSLTDEQASTITVGTGAWKLDADEVAPFPIAVVSESQVLSEIQAAKEQEHAADADKLKEAAAQLMAQADAVEKQG